MHTWPTILRHGDLTLRPIRWRDEAAWRRVREENSHWLDHWETSDPTGAEPTTFRRWVTHYRRRGRLGKALPLVLEIGADRFAGQISASPIHYQASRSAVIGYWIAERHAGQGYTPLAVALVTDYLVQEMGIHRIEINVRPENHASLRVVEKLGFVEEGYARGFLYIDGDWRDHRRFALLAEDLPAGGLLAGYLNRCTETID
ncbi:MAG: GNAT family protein [Bowdeniella nasicola]|nr:GNAT family protein [Bowdeniella nasicola]